VTPLCTRHVTLLLAVFATSAENWAVLDCAPEGERNAYSGDTVTATGPVCPAIVIIALPLWDGSALLVAATVTGFAVGTAAGAR